MARTVRLACARCGHPEMVVVESADNAEIVRAAGAGTIAADDSSAAAELRLERLKWLPTSLPVGGIITPV